MVGPTVRRSKSSSPAMSRPGSIASGASGWRRAKASRCRVSRAPRITPARAASSRDCTKLSGTASRANRLSTSSRLAEMTCSRLLKSCATPPVIWPSTSIFWACRAVSSALTRREMSATASKVPPSGMTLRDSSSVRAPANVSAGSAPGSIAARPGTWSAAASSPAQHCPSRTCSGGRPRLEASCTLRKINWPLRSNTATPSRMRSMAAASRSPTSRSVSWVVIRRARLIRTASSARPSAITPRTAAACVANPSRLCRSCSAAACTRSSLSSRVPMRVTRARASSISSVPRAVVTIANAPAISPDRARATLCSSSLIFCSASSASASVSGRSHLLPRAASRSVARAGASRLVAPV